MAIKKYLKGSKEKLAKNFSAYEFDCPGKGCCTETPVDELLVDYLQQIRDHFNAPVRIFAYRCPVHNAKVKNASKTSKHMKGMAADITVEGVPPAEVAKYAESIGVKGIGLYEGKDGNFVHIDTRTVKSFWYGHAQAYRSTFGGTPVPEIQATDYTLKQFVRDVQSACGANVDGIAGNETLSKTVTVSAVTNRRHPVVKAIQKRLVALGYKQIGTVDGIAGNKFKEAVKAYQKDHNCKEDGVITARQKTWRSLLEMDV